MIAELIAMLPAQAPAPIIGPPTVSIGWTMYLAILCSPALLGVAATMAATLFWRIERRDAGKPPPKPSEINRVAITAGAVLGPACQLGLQGAIHWMTKVPIFWEFVPLAIVLTGGMAIISYKLLDWLLIKWGMTGVRAWLRVRHVAGKDNTGVEASQ